MLSLPRPIVNQLLHQAQIHAETSTFGYLVKQAAEWQICPAQTTNLASFLQTLLQKTVTAVYYVPGLKEDSELIKSQLHKDWLYLEISRRIPGVLEILAYQWQESGWLNCPLVLTETD